MSIARRAFVGVLVVACALASARPSRAGFPQPPNVTIGKGVHLGGLTGNTVDPRVEKTIIVRDNSNQPIQNVTVTIDFSACVGQGFRLCAVQPFPNMSIVCGASAVAAVTDVNGVAVFRVVGSEGNNGGNPPGAGSAPCAEVRADGVTVGFLLVGAYDQNGGGGVNPADVSAFYGDRFATQPANYRQRSDYDFNGGVNPADASLILGVRFGGGSMESCASNCP